MNRSLLSKPLVRSMLLVVASALFALVVWSIPTWPEFAHTFSQLPALWQVSSNQDIIKSMLAKVFSPLIVPLLIVAPCCWLWFTIKPYLWSGKAAPTHPQHLLPRPWTPPTTAPSTLRSQNLSLPVTPLPPVLADDQVTPPEPAVIPQEDSDQVAPPVVVTTAPDHPVEEDESLVQGPVYVNINLFGEVRMTLRTPDGAVSMPVPLSGATKRVQLLAYLAWLQGGKVDRVNLLEHVFGHGKSDEQASPKILGDAFDSHRKFIRQDLRAAIKEINTQAGREAIPPDLDLFGNHKGFWWLAPVCKVVDLGAVDAAYRIIEKADNDGLLANSIPEHVYAACQAILQDYTGDFLENLLAAHPDEFDPWLTSWFRKPFTLYRDRYLDALWFAASYELKKGQALDGVTDEAKLQEQRRHYDRAARLYATYARHAVNSKYDLKVSFSRSGRVHGDRIVQSERAIRRAIMLYGAVDNTRMVDKVWGEYYRHMRIFSANLWNPDPDTEKDLEAARSRTSAFRLPAQISITPPGSLPHNLETADRS